MIFHSCFQNVTGSFLIAAMFQPIHISQSEEDPKGSLAGQAGAAALLRFYACRAILVAHGKLGKLVLRPNAAQVPRDTL